MGAPVPICKSTLRKPKFAVSAHWAFASGFGPDTIASAAINQNMLSYLQREPPRAFHSVMTMLDFLHAKAQRWPLQVRILLNQDRYKSDEPFETAARQGDLKRRQQAMSVWANMLCFIAAYWDISCSDLEKMGLFLSEDMKVHVENVSIWDELGGNRKRIEETAKDFFILAVTDPKPSPRTNPILWWLTAVINDRLVNGPPELPVEGFEKESVQNLDLDSKLEALDYFARVLILEVLIHTWTPSDMYRRISWPPSYRFQTSAMKQQILTLLDRNDTTRAYQDKERLGTPFQRDDRILNAPAWRECIAHLETLIDDWLANHARGPICEILSLSRGVLPIRTYEDQVKLPKCRIGASRECVCVEDKYEVVIEIWANFTDAMGAYDGGFGRAITAGAHRVESDKDLAGANQAAREVIELEFGREKDARMWMEHVRADGTVRVIAVFVDKTHNSKVDTWVQKRVC
ncbi:hypothetical protein JMJ35_009369 [Cladonia borealis]|uniref:Uncharacterized protein n=1 Tax=Cladonia borealis TaxID=184061 RepID=A0AA39QSD2_9LECA|nr:hypothetical protein JMJ35_009369 [Cladonia borealis]